jgi:4-amino-4-deoxy-L-arabinose transferase-like glycosyltransferase
VIRHPDLAGYFLGHEVVGRNFSSESRRNPQWYAPFVLYLPFLIAGQGVWLFHGVRLIKGTGIYKPQTIARLFRAAGAPSVLLLLWFVIPLAVFWFSKSRLPLYLLPLFAPLAIATARHIVRTDGARSGARKALWLALVSVLVIIAVKAYAPHRPYRRDMGRLYEAAASAAGGDVVYVMFRESDLYGFDFYADGKVRRVSDKPGTGWADQDLESLVEEISSARAPRGYVIIASDRNAPLAARALSQAGASFTQRDADSWKLLVVPHG